jgi:hypothetical protein
MAGRRRDSSITPEQYWNPRGSISEQLRRQPRPDRHDYSSTLPPHLDFTTWPDLPLHPDMLELFLRTPHATCIYPPFVFRPADAHGWAILNDASLLPSVTGFGLVTDGEGRVLGQIFGAGFPAQASMLYTMNQFSSMDLGHPSPGDSFITNPWTPSSQQPPDLASPGSTKASLESEAETTVARSEVSKKPEQTDRYLLVYDRNFDVGVTPL